MHYSSTFGHAKAQAHTSLTPASYFCLLCAQEDSFFFYTEFLFSSSLTHTYEYAHTETAWLTISLHMEKRTLKRVSSAHRQSSVPLSPCKVHTSINAVAPLGTVKKVNALQLGPARVSSHRRQPDTNQQSLKTFTVRDQDKGVSVALKGFLCRKKVGIFDVQIKEWQIALLVIIVFFMFVPLVLWLTFRRRLLVLTYQLVSMSTNLTRRGTTVYRR